MRKVNDHITLLDPKNVADRLKAVASSIEAKKALAAQKQQFAANAAEALKKAKADNDTAAEALKKAQMDYDTAAAEAKTATDEANKEQTENSVQSLSAEANDFSDLKRLPELKELPAQLQDLCGKPPVCQLAE